MAWSIPAARRALGSRLAAWTLLGLGSCWGPIPELTTEADITAIAGVADGLVFRSEGSGADAPPPGMPVAADRLDLDQALRRAVLGDPGLQAALARVQGALANANQARTLPNPILGFVLRWGPGRPQIEATLTDSLLAVLQAPRRARAADHELRAAAAAALTAALDVVADLQIRYTEAQAADRIVPLLEERLGLLAQLVLVAESRRLHGEGSEADVATLAGQRLELEVELATARLQQRDTRLQLARRIGEPSATALWSLDALAVPEALAGTENAWIRAGLCHRPELSAIAWRLAALGDERAAARWAPWQDTDLGVDAQRTPDWFVGPTLSLPLPLFDGGGAVAERLAAEQSAMQHELTATLRLVIEEVRRAFAAFTAQRANLLRVREQWIPLQEQRCRQAESAFRLGHADSTALLLAEQGLSAALLRARELERDTGLSFVHLQRAAGGALASRYAAEPTSHSEPPGQPTDSTPNH